MTYSILDLIQTFVGGTMFGMGLAGLLWKMTNFGGRND